MARLVDDEGHLLKSKKTCRGVCDEHTFCCDCPINEALKKLAEYERKEKEEDWIPVEEGLPELLPNDNCTADVLVSILDESDPEAGTSTCAGFMEDGEWYTYSDHDYEKVGSTKGFKDKVVAWRKMPADYVMKERE